MKLSTPATAVFLFIATCWIQPSQQHSSSDLLFKRPTTIVLQSADKNKTRFTQEEKDLILNIHNSYRSLVEPPATDMRELIWDEDLEDYAWNHTQKCTGAHSAGSMVKKWGEDPLQWVTWNYMGENLYYRYAPTYSIEEAMFLFWEEGQYYDIFNTSCVPGKVCGHYQVMTTAKSYRVGCAMNTCQNFSISSYPTPAIFFSCNYNAEYWTYARPYTIGARCSDCTYEKQGIAFQWCRHFLCLYDTLFYDNTGWDGDTRVVDLYPTNLTTTPTTTESFTTTVPSTSDSVTFTTTSPTHHTMSSTSNLSSTFSSDKVTSSTEASKSETTAKTISTTSSADNLTSKIHMTSTSSITSTISTTSPTNHTMSSTSDSITSTISTPSPTNHTMSSTSDSITSTISTTSHTINRTVAPSGSRTYTLLVLMIDVILVVGL